MKPGRFIGYCSLFGIIVVAAVIMSETYLRINNPNSGFELGNELDRIRKSKTDLTRVFTPKLRAPKKWRPYGREQRAAIIRILEELKIRYFDLYDRLQRL